METQSQQKYAVTNDLKFKYVIIVLINQIINFQTYFSVAVEGDDMFLDDYLKYMLNHGLLEVKEDKYIPTAKGREYLQQFYNKYFEFIKMFDIFCAVDLEKGEFAFSSMFNNDLDDAAWNIFLSDERFSDVRVAVSEFKGIDPVEVVFMSFLNEGRFDTSSNGWQIFLTKDGVWNEVVEICNTAIKLDYLKQNDVIQDVVKQGSAIAIDLHRQAAKILEEEQSQQNQQEEEEEEEETTTTTIEYVDIVEEPYYSYGYFDPYYDPFYISPIWLVPFLF